jgi:hypothetical protein
MAAKRSRSFRLIFKVSIASLVATATTALWGHSHRVQKGTFSKSRDSHQLGIVGVTLHSYRYAWAERAKTVGYPEDSRRRHWDKIATPSIARTRSEP